MDALGGLQVIDLSDGIAGPIVGAFFADFGAEVIKVEPPGGDPARDEPGFAAWNRGKKSVTADPADPAGRSWLAALIEGADVCVVSSCGTLTAYGLDWWRLLRSNPALVLVETPPYAGGAPWYGGAESQGLLAAALGVAWRQSSYDGGPVESVARFLLQVHGVWATVCAVAALLERERSGFGQLVNVTAVHAAMEANIGAYSVNPAMPDPPAGVGPGGRHPTYTRFVARDGKWLASGTLGIPCGALADRADWLDHPQVQAIGMRAEVDDPERGRVVMPGVPVNLTESPGWVRGPAPRQGRDAFVPARDPRPAPEGPAPISEGPLAGIRVLDLGTFVAAPYAGALLAELGADVIKVEPPAGDPFRVSGFVFNRGMRSLAVNLRQSDGVRAFRRLAAASDVVVAGLRPGVAAKLGIDHDTLAGDNPGLVSVTLSAYGEGGPLSHLPGVDMVIQGMSGMMSAQGGDSAPVANTIAIIDVTTAAMIALSAVLALLHRERGGTGRGQRAWVSLAGTATYLQTGEIVRYPGRPPAVGGGRDYAGAHPLDRYYRAGDGWVRVHAAHPVTVAELRAAGLPVAPGAFAADPGAALAAALADLTPDVAADRLNRAHVAATPARRVSAVVRDPQLVVSEFVHVRPSGHGAVYVTPGRLAGFSRTPRFGPLRSPGVGEHSRAALRSAGLTEEAVTALVAANVVIDGAPMPQGLATAYR
jgi:crotonobetainyl-CoA:carnitine CoA-transferase CaiB-like acyl-CoA transferase